MRNAGPGTTGSYRDDTLTRWALIGAILLVPASAGVEAALFPGILTPPAEVVAYLIVFALTLAAYGAMAVSVTRSTSLAAEVASANALRWGAVTGALWWIEILEANVWRLSGLWLALLYFGAATAAYLMPGVAAALTARRTGRWRAGLAAGLWSGMVGGLLTFLGGTAMLWLFNATFLHDPQTMQEYLRAYARGLAPDLQTYVVGDLLAGLIAHLAVIGVVLGAMVGAIGASIGRALGPSPRGGSVGAPGLG
jgi:hypothetical protein